MSATSTFRPALLRSAFRPALRQPLRKQILQKRGQSTTAVGSETQELSYLQKLWRSEVGPKTVHFWAPIFKWGVVLAGASDFARPAESLSLSQNLALMGTGSIWTRWCFVIRPKNMFLASVNFCLFCVGATQVGRIVAYRNSLTDKTLVEQAKETAEDVAEQAKTAAKDPKTLLNK